MRVIHFFLMSLVIVPAFLSCSRGVENKFLVSLIGSGFITRKEAREEDGLRFVLGSVEFLKN